MMPPDTAGEWSRLSRAELEQRAAALAARNAEMERQLAATGRADGAALDSNFLLQAMLDNTPDRIYFKDARSRFIKCSRAVARRLGVADPAQVLGKTDFDFLPP